MVWDVVMTDSARYADILLPDLTTQEQVSVTANSYNDNVKAVVFGKPAYEPKFERRGAYEVCCDLAERFGVLDEYTTAARRAKTGTASSTMRCARRTSSFPRGKRAWRWACTRKRWWARTSR